MAPVPVAAAPSDALRRTWPGRINSVLQTLVRYLLGFGMLPYGISKLCNFQFQLPAWIYSQPLGDAPGTSLTWAFLGYQPWFQFLLGALEFIPAVMLFFRRTRRAGALLMLPMLLNVTLMNWAMDLWPATRLISTTMLIMNVYLLACDFPMWQRFAREIFSRPPAPASRRRRVSTAAEFVAAFALIAAAAGYFYSEVSAIAFPLVDFVGVRQINHAGTWAVRAITIDGSDLPVYGEPLLYFDFAKRCHLIADNGIFNGTFDANRDRHSFQIDRVLVAPGVTSIRGSYRVEGDRLILDGNSGSTRVHLAIERYGWGKQLPFEGAPPSAPRQKKR